MSDTLFAILKYFVHFMRYNPFFSLKKLVDYIKVEITVHLAAPSLSSGSLLLTLKYIPSHACQSLPLAKKLTACGKAPPDPHAVVSHHVSHNVYSILDL